MISYSLVCQGTRRKHRHCARPWTPARNWVSQWLQRRYVEGLATCLTFLGIQIDTHALELSLPQAKLERVAVVVARWSQSKVVSKRDLQSLIGLLSHAATVVPPGHTFIRRLIDTVRAGKRPHHQLRLNAECRSDLMWWATFLPHWNGRSLMLQPSPSMTITCDASGQEPGRGHGVVEHGHQMTSGYRCNGQRSGRGCL